LDLDPSLV